MVVFCMVAGLAAAGGAEVGATAFGYCMVADAVAGAGIGAGVSADQWNRQRQAQCKARIAANNINKSAEVYKKQWNQLCCDLTNIDENLLTQITATQNKIQRD